MNPITRTVTLSVNAGVSLALSTANIWVDVLHEKKLLSFSTLSPSLQTALWRHEAFQAPNMICFTHCHSDHFSRNLALVSQGKWPNAAFVLPEWEPALNHQIVLQDENVELEINGIELHFFRVTHEGKDYASVPHYGLFIDDHGFRILIPGDSEIAHSKIEAIAGQCSIDLLLLNFPWICQEKGRRFIRTQIRPKHILVYHLPALEDDVWGYGQGTRKAIAKMSGEADVNLLQTPFSCWKITQ